VTEPPVRTPRIDDAFRIAGEHEVAGRFDEARLLLEQILAAAPDAPGPLHLLGVVAYRQGRIDEALGFMERSLRINRDQPLPCRNICEVYRALGRTGDALDAGRRAVALGPGDPLSLLNLALIHSDRLEFDDTIDCAERALRLDPKLAAAHFELAKAYLVQGDFARGWEKYEWRYRIAGAAPPIPETDRPQWDGRPLGAGRLLLIGDQGFGDVIQFARYIPWALQRCPDLVVAASPEMRPIVEQFGRFPVVDRWEQVQGFVAYCPLSGLPRLAGTRLETIPAAIPYLRADPERSGRWQQRLAALVPSGYRRIGLVWAGRPTHRNDRLRSCGLARLAPLADTPGIALISLQKGPAAGQIKQYFGRAPLLNLDPEIDDFRDTMAILDHLDLVVTVDTAIGHLAGAMGKPVWIMLAHAADWRWLLGRSDTRWYPTARLFRQSAPEDWDGVAAVVARGLRG
jgi:hypothetical protein